MKQKFIIEVEWADGKPSSSEFIHKILDDGMSDNGFDWYDQDEEGRGYGDYCILSVEEFRCET